MKIRNSFLRICQIVCLFAFGILLTHSNLVRCYAAEGIRAWAVSVLPVLLPFIILSRFWIYYDVPSFIFTICKKIMPKHPSLTLLATILLLGLASGFPIGAVFVNYFYDRKFLTKKAAENLLPLCSFVSPMFLMGYVRPLTGYKGIMWYFFCISLYLPVLILFILKIQTGEIQIRKDFLSGKNLFSSRSGEKETIRNIWISSLEIIFTIGIYMMLFSILFGLSTNQSVFNNVVWKIVLANLEITVGIDQLSRMTEIQGILRGMILAASVSLGGLCTMAQVYSIVSESDLSLKPYIHMKWKSAALSGILLFLFFLLFKVFFTAGSSGTIS